MNKYIISISILIILFMIGCSDGVVGQGTGASTNTNADLTIQQEFDEVKWIKIEKAKTILTFQSESDIINKILTNESYI